ncbi:MAG: monofunctional biosynthetic peptidoglycan transglycosylase [Gammaproteobacteria bacterium]|nr:monofunctional biosynthetic peptidoglycan transglycosylase [Gammaproteobacteria bacterium]
MRRKKPGRLKRAVRKALLWGLTMVVMASALPMVLIRFVDPPTSMFIELNKRAHNTNIKHDWRDMEEVSLYFPVAVIASEDQQFPHHFGFDLAQIMLVLEDQEQGLSRGASTISQQTVKNLFLWPDRSLLRKGVEAWLTVWLELIVPKRRILEIYINYAQFGTSVFGVGAASEYYFGIPASQLSPRQSALIAASLPTPSRSNPADPSEYLLERAAYIEDQMPRVGGRRIVREL